MIDWRHIDTVLLDMDGTLLDLHFDTHFWLEHLPRRYCEIHQLDASHARALVERILSERGTLNWYSLHYWQRELEVDMVSLKRELSHLIGYRSDAHEFLEWLHDAPQRVVLATNADRAGMTLKLELTGLGRYVDALVSSEDMGAPKESPEFWQALLAHQPHDPARTLLIDDNPAVLGCARQSGIGHLLGIRQPDSQREPIELEEFTCLDRFASVMRA
ncbi:HAD-IA family hydrolase [Kushneria phosphatilytica]|uniref:HAD-IA family hydrolase n=1 Tax=Kushneria phosphatilytica TaxID=657387 RepID=A0A1S1NUH5_9GAMM|nr:HAD-IA family hydrolase [Kushneria phosphatilytica]OHV09716.1 haloacid dehalogenase [Kushneria phosphatilytica]QEL11762.1 HAD-IA family hydrolase [Kushneria phosphatilytica]